MSKNTDSKTEEEPESSVTAKSPAKTTGTTAKPPILNPAWAEEAVKARGLTGALAKAVAADLVKEVTKHVTKAVNDKKVDKIVGKSFTTHMGMTRGA